MITVAGVVFSITIVVLSLASSQFGPRLIRNFMNVRANQMVLGTFVATFIYGVLVLRTVNAVMEARFVPGLSVTIAVVMSLLSLGVLIYFIHNVSESIQAQNIIARVCSDLDKAVDRIFPERLGQEEDLSNGPIKRDYDIPKDMRPRSLPGQGRTQRLSASHRQRRTDADSHRRKPSYPSWIPSGQFYHPRQCPGDRLAGEKVDERLSEKINAIFILGPERTLEQDVEFAISQLVEIAVRALSPGINDPITANTCIDWLGVILSQLANRKMPSSHRFDQEGRLRVICKPFAFEGMVDAAFNMIRQNSQSVAAVSIHLLETIATVAAQTYREEDRTALSRHAAMVVHGCKERLSADDDRERS